MNQLKAGAALNYTVIVLDILVGLLYTPFLLRILGQSDYGIYSLVASVISYLTILDLGFGNAIIRYTAKFRAEGKIREQYELFGMFLILYTIIGLISMALGYVLYTHVDAWFGHTMTMEEMEKTRTMLLLLIFNLSFTFPMSVFGAIIQAYERFVFPKVVNILRILLNTGIMILLLELGYRVVAMVVLQTIFNFLTLICNFYYCRYKLRIKIWFHNFQWGFLKEVATYSFWIFLGVILDRIYWNTGQFVLAVYVNTATVAVFAIAVQLCIMYMSFSTSISGVFLPKVTGMVACNDNREEISSLFIRTGRIQYIVMALVLSGFIVFGHDFIRLWAGNGYEDAYTIALLFFIVLTIPMIQNLGTTILQARNQMKFRALVYLGIGVFGYWRSESVFPIAFVQALWGHRVYGCHCGCFVGWAGDSHQSVLPFPARIGHHCLLEGDCEDVGGSCTDVCGFQIVVEAFLVGQLAIFRYGYFHLSDSLYSVVLPFRHESL